MYAVTLFSLPQADVVTPSQSPVAQPEFFTWPILWLHWRRLVPQSPPEQNHSIF